MTITIYIYIAVEISDTNILKLQHANDEITATASRFSTCGYRRGGKHDSDWAWNHLVPESPWSKTQWDRHSRNARWFIINQFHKGSVCWKAVPAALNLYFQNFCSKQSSSVHLFIHLYFLLSNRSNMILICAISLQTLNWSTSLTVCLTTSFSKKTQILTADCSPNTVIEYICFLHACAISNQPKTSLFGCSSNCLPWSSLKHIDISTSREPPTVNRNPPRPSESSHSLQRLGTLAFQKVRTRLTLFFGGLTFQFYGSNLPTYALFGLGRTCQKKRSMIINVFMYNVDSVIRQYMYECHKQNQKKQNLMILYKQICICK